MKSALTEQFQLMKTVSKIFNKLDLLFEGVRLKYGTKLGLD
mgnify:CR=1 FL=1